MWPPSRRVLEKLGEPLKVGGQLIGSLRAQCQIEGEALVSVAIASGRYFAAPIRMSK
jgi:hypothetical protein